jgi:hypothetical protein
LGMYTKISLEQTVSMIVGATVVRNHVTCVYLCQRRTIGERKEVTKKRKGRNRVFEAAVLQRSRSLSTGKRVSPNSFYTICS